MSDRIAPGAADSLPDPAEEGAGAGPAGLGSFLAALRDALGGDDVSVDTEAIWRRVLQRLDDAGAPGEEFPGAASHRGPPIR